MKDMKRFLTIGVVLTILLATGATRATVALGQYKFENSLAPSGEQTGLDFGNFYINTALVDYRYNSGTTLATDNWDVTNYLVGAYSTNHYVGFTVTPVAGSTSASRSFAMICSGVFFLIGNS